MNRSRHAPRQVSLEMDEAFARLLHEAELQSFEARFGSSSMFSNDPFRRLSERGRRINGQPGPWGSGIDFTLMAAELRQQRRRVEAFNDHSRGILDRLARITAELETSREDREAQMARDEQEAARLDALERAKETQIAEDRELAERLQYDTSFDEDDVSLYPEYLEGFQFYPSEPDWEPIINNTSSLDDIPTRRHNSTTPSSRTQRRITTVLPPAPALPTPRTLDCAVCLTAHPANRMAHLPCGHDYCSECISALVDAAITASISRLNPAAFPPSCCPGHPIPQDAVMSHLSRPVHDAFSRHANLLATPIEQRVWCAGAGCGRFIPTTSSRSIRADHNSDRRGARTALVRCATCATQTCMQCKRAAAEHMGGAGGVCPEDGDVKALLATAQQRGWQQCYRCHNMVEKRDGCNHMTCTCGAQFCYVCGARWQGRHCDHGVFAED